jgi:hypothetical protein
LAIDEQVAAFGVLQRHDRGGVVEDLMQPCLAVLELALHPRALGDVLVQPRLRLLYIERHRVERAGEARELVATLEAAPHREVAGSEILGRVDEPPRTPRQQEVEHQPHRQREHGDPARPQQRLPHHLRARFRLVALQVVGDEEAAGARWP